MRTALLFVASTACVFGCSSHDSAGTADAARDGTSGGSADAPADGGAAAQTVALTLTNRPAVPATFVFVVAYEDGDDAWSLAPSPGSGDTYELPITSDHYAIAWTCVGVSSVDRDVTLGYFETAQQPSLTLTIPDRCTDAAPATTRLSGIVGGVPANGTLTVYAGARSVAVAAGSGSGASGAYAVDVDPGTYDLVVLHTAAASAVADRILVKRGVVIGATNTTQALDFANAVAPQAFAVTVGGTGAGTQVDTTTTLSVAGTDTVPLIAQTSAGSGTPAFETLALAAADQLATDVYAQRITVTEAGSTLEVASFTASPAAQAYAAPAALGGALSSVPATTPYPEVKLAWNAYADAIGYVVEARQGCGGTGSCNTWTAAISAGAAGSSPSFQMPDLSALAGWDDRLQFATGTAVQGSVTAETSTAGASDFAAASPTAGTTRTLASQAFSVTP